MKKHYINKWYNGHRVYRIIIDPYNPLDLPLNTIRCKFKSGHTPTYRGDTQTLVDSTNNVWDIYKQSNNWESLFGNSVELLEVLGANTTNVTTMRGIFYNCSSLSNITLFDTSNVTYMRDMFYECKSLTTVPLFNTSKVLLMDAMFFNCKSLASVPLFDTSNVINMGTMFGNCKALTAIPLFDTSKVIDMSYMFAGCTNVQSGSLALYQQASTQANPPTYHSEAFSDCGINTQTGSSELAQIPSDWK